MRKVSDMMCRVYYSIRTYPFSANILNQAVNLNNDFKLHRKILTSMALVLKTSVCGSGSMDFCMIDGAVKVINSLSDVISRVVDTFSKEVFFMLT